jgi:hypothetical protein
MWPGLPAQAPCFLLMQQFYAVCGGCNDYATYSIPAISAQIARLMPNRTDDQCRRAWTQLQTRGVVSVPLLCFCHI